MTHVLLMTKEGCNPCGRVKRILDEIAREQRGITIEVVDFASEQGLALALEHNVLYPPAVIVDGAFLGYGKIKEDRLREALHALPSPGVDHG
ncbi:MAG: thioredoxin family protein [Candidatus Thermoplasmatota archaeon]